MSIAHWPLFFEGWAPRGQETFATTPTRAPDKRSPGRCVMRFRTHLVVGVGALIAITLASGVLAAAALYGTADRAAEATRDVVGELAAVQQVRLHAEEVVATARGYLLTGSEMHRRRLD